MTKQDKIGTVLRKLDYLWSKKGMTFCKAVKELTNNNMELSDDDIINNLKDIYPEDKQKDDTSKS